jgi:hypothetical protein
LISTGHGQPGLRQIGVPGRRVTADPEAAPAAEQATRHRG